MNLVSLSMIYDASVQIKKLVFEVCLSHAVSPLDCLSARVAYRRPIFNRCPGKTAGKRVANCLASLRLAYSEAGGTTGDAAAF